MKGKMTKKDYRKMFKEIFGEKAMEKIEQRSQNELERKNGR